jgi:glycosyltransferase involved in cell wall biosynthesis
MDGPVNLAVNALPTLGPDRVPLLIVLPADPERMRIGGIASFIRGFVKFAPTDFDFAFIGMTSDRPLWRWQQIDLEGRTIQFLPVAHGGPTGRRLVPAALRFVAALMTHRAQWQCDGWIVSFHRPGTELPFLSSPFPKWRVVHLGLEELQTAGSESRWRRLATLLGALERRAFRKMDRIYVVNESAAERYRARFPEVAGRIEFLPNWADSTIFRPESEERRGILRAELASELRLPPEGPVVLFAGRLEGQKDPLLLAAAFAAFRGRHPTARLLVAGEGSLRPKLERDLQSRQAFGATRFLGTVSRERLAGLMNASDALVIASAFETGPTVGLESLASGLPVVTTRVGEVAGIVERSGAGRVASERNAEGLASALEWVITQPTAVLRERTVTSVAPYLAETVLGRLYDYNRLLAERLPPRPSARLLRK